MVIRIPGLMQTAQQEPQGPRPGPDPAWATFTRTSPGLGKPGNVSLHAFKPDVAGYRVLGGEPQRQSPSRHGAPPERNRYNSSIYIASVDRYRNLPSSKAARIPVTGEIAAGQYDMTVAFQEHDCLDYEGGVIVEKALVRGGAYALRVRGTSMTHVGIEPGDVVIVRPQDWAEDGDFVVASFTDGVAGGSEGLATLKRFYKKRDHIFLQSATASTEPIRLFPSKRNGSPDCDTVKVQGVVTMILKAQ